MEPGSSSRISKAVDDALERSVPKSKFSNPGLSVRNGPITGGDAMDEDAPLTNGVAKRKSRSSISKVNYKDDSDGSDDEAPLVGPFSTQHINRQVS
jgi:DNA topoisomerase I